MLSNMDVIIIKEDGTFYTTVAFAIHFDGDDTEYFILNEDDEFERVFEYITIDDKKYRIVLFNDEYRSTDDIVKIGTYAGYERFIKDKKLLNRIRNGEKNIFSNEDMIYYRSIKHTRGLNPIVEDEHSCASLYNMCDRFEGTTIKEYTYDKKDKHLTFVLDGIWGMDKLVLNFYGVKEYNISKDYDSDNFIFIASLLYENDMVYFVDYDCFEIEDLDDAYTYVICKRIEYSFIPTKYKK